MSVKIPQWLRDLAAQADDDKWPGGFVDVAGAARGLACRRSSGVNDTRLVQLLIDEVTRLRVTESWRPFATAPPDSTQIIVWRKDAGVFTARFLPAGDGPGTEDADFCEVYPEECCWFTSDGDDLTGDLPTLWKPLPAEPGKTATDKGAKQ